MQPPTWGLDGHLLSPHCSLSPQLSKELGLVSLGGLTHCSGKKRYVGWGLGWGQRVGSIPWSAFLSTGPGQCPEGMWWRLPPARRPHPVGDAGPSQARQGLRTLRDRGGRVLEGSQPPALGDWSQRMARARMASWPQPVKEGHPRPLGLGLGTIREAQP